MQQCKYGAQTVENWIKINKRRFELQNQAATKVQESDKPGPTKLVKVQARKITGSNKQLLTKIQEKKPSQATTKVEERKKQSVVKVHERKRPGHTKQTLKKIKRKRGHALRNRNQQRFNRKRSHKAAMRSWCTTT